MWFRIKQELPELSGIYSGRSVPRSQGEADASGSYAAFKKIVFKLPGKHASMFRDRCIGFLRILNPTEDFIDELRTRMEDAYNGRSTVSEFLLDAPGQARLAADSPLDDTTHLRPHSHS
jgi:hypothetical protein